jgi:peptidyl-prolyl cis-trans isomerase A (cyclophilin A)
MDVVEKIRKVRTTQRGMHGDVPTEPIVIKQATIEK